MTAALLALLSTALMQVGYLAWKVVADRRRAQAGAASPLLRRGLWWWGAASVVAGWGLFVAAAALGDISVVQPLMSTGDLLLVAAAVLWLGERLRPLEWLGIALALLGVWLLALQAHASAPAVAWTPLAAVCAGSVAGALLLGLLARRGDAVPVACQVGIAFGLGALLTKSCLAGLALGAGPALAAVQAAGLLAANGLGLWRLQRAFLLGRAAVVVPLVLAMANLVAVLGAGLALGEDVNAARLLAVAVIVAGTLAFLLRRPQPALQGA